MSSAIVCRQGHPYSPENTRVETIRQRGREYRVRRCKRCWQTAAHRQSFPKYWKPLPAPKVTA